MLDPVSADRPERTSTRDYVTGIKLAIIVTAVVFASFFMNEFLQIKSIKVVVTEARNGQGQPISYITGRGRRRQTLDEVMLNGTGVCI